MRSLIFSLLAFVAIYGTARATQPSPTYQNVTIQGVLTLPGGNVGTSSLYNIGTSVSSPGTATLEAVLPIQTVTGTSKTFATADLFKKTRRSNSGTSMTDTLPASSATGMVNGTRINIINTDATASDTVTAGAGTTIGGNATYVIPAGRDLMWVYDLTNTAWRADANTGTAALTNGPNTFTGTQTISSLAATGGSILNTPISGSTGGFTPNVNATGSVSGYFETNSALTNTQSLINLASPEAVPTESGLGTEASPFTNSTDLTAGLQTQVNALEAGRGGSIKLSGARYNVSASTVVTTPGVNFICDGAGWNIDPNGDSEGVMGGCKVRPTTALTSGVFEFGATSPSTTRLEGLGLQNVYMYGSASPIYQTGSATPDGSACVNVVNGLDQVRFNQLMCSNFNYGILLSAPHGNADSSYFFQSSFNGGGWGIFFAPGSLGTDNFHLVSDDISDNTQEGFADFSQTPAPMGMMTGMDFWRNSSQLTLYNAYISTTNMTVTGAPTNGILAPGKIVVGAGVTAHTVIASQTSGTTGGAGVYVVNNSQTVGSSGSPVAMTSGGAGVYSDGTGLQLTNSIISGTGHNQIANTDVYADGILLGGARGNAIITDNYINGNTDGCGIRVTSVGNLISSNIFGNNGSCGDVLFDGGSAYNVLFSPYPVVYTDNGSNNTAFYLDASRNWRVEGPLFGANGIGVTGGSTAAAAANNTTIDISSGVTRFLSFGSNTSTYGGYDFRLLYSNGGSSITPFSIGNYGVTITGTGATTGIMKMGTASTYYVEGFGGASGGTVTTNAGTLTLSSGGGATTIINDSAPTLPNITTGTNADFLCRSSDGVILLQTSACTLSSKRFKNMLPDYSGDALGVLTSLPVGTFTLKDQESNPDHNATREQIGLYAEDIAKAEPRAAIYEQDGLTPKSYRQESIIAMLVAADKQLDAKIDAVAAHSDTNAADPIVAMKDDITDVSMKADGALIDEHKLDNRLTEINAALNARLDRQQKEINGLVAWGVLSALGLAYVGNRRK